jgi:hypothetical protein
MTTVTTPPDLDAMSAADLWVDAYQGEVLGEALFGALVSRQADPARRHQLELLTLLERATKELAEPVLEKRRLPRGDSAGSVEMGRELAAGVADVPWEEFLRSFEPVTSQFLARYRRLVELASDHTERAVAQSYVDHEQALMGFVRRALGEEPGDPLEPILKLPHVAAVATA